MENMEHKDKQLWIFEYQIIAGCPCTGTYRGIVANTIQEAEVTGFDMMLNQLQIHPVAITYGSYKAIPQRSS